jgi:hypothetical protein
MLLSLVVSRSNEGTCQSPCGCLWASRTRAGGVWRGLSPRTALSQRKNCFPFPLTPCPYRLPPARAGAVLPQAEMRFQDEFGRLSRLPFFSDGLSHRRAHGAA